MVLKTLDEAVKNLETATAYIRSRYERGIDKATWFENAKSDEAEKNFKDAMTKVIEEERRKRGIERLGGDGAWKDGAKKKGAPVIATRIKDALPKYRANFGDVYSKVIEIVKGLPRRGISWEENIENRLKPVVRAWVENKIRGRG